MQKLENIANQILYSYVSKGQAYTLPANITTFVDEGFAGNVNIYAIVRKIVNPTIGVKWELKDKAGNEIEQHYLLDLLKRPNSSQRWNAFVDEAISWMLITGNRYIYTIQYESGADKGKPAEMHLLPASEVEILQGDWLNPVKGYHLRIGDTYKEIPANYVVHSKYTNLRYDIAGSQLYGMSPLESALKVMQATNMGYLGLTKQFENGGPDVIVTGTQPDENEYTQEQKQTIWSDFVKRFSGGKNKGKWLIKNKPVQVHEIGKSPVDLGTLEYIKLSLRDYCNIYGVPSALMNDNEYATQSAAVSEYMRQLWNNAVIPELERLKDDMNQVAEMYNKATGEMVYFDYCLDDIPELQKDKNTQIAALTNAHWLTLNERREMMDFEAIDDPTMDEIYTPMGLVPISELTNIPDEETNKALDQRGVKY